MLKKYVFVCLAVFVCMVVASAAMAIDMNDGKWEISSRVEIPGMPMQIPASTTTECLTKDKPAPAPPQMPAGCEMPDIKISGNTVTWSVNCTQFTPSMMSKGTITYQGDSFEGVVENEMIQKGGNMHMTVRMKGKRIGACD
ncbi:MAG: DUF3617 family protein [Deltaproteobacteria bacterium]|nr:DUF3617 family protein [Deltaproteobacteria bacterium]